jgi:hypothetical protein
MNLDCHSSQRSEGYHPVLRIITNGQLSFEQSAKRLVAMVLGILKTLDLDEDTSERDRPRRLQRDTPAFRCLFNQISLFALDKLANEWELVKEIAANQRDLSTEICYCRLRLQWYLPCKHQLFGLASSGLPIPKSLVHPRWWIRGPPIRTIGWVPVYQEESQQTGVLTTNYLSLQRRQLTSTDQSLLTIRDALSGTEQALSMRR